MELKWTNAQDCGFAALAAQLDGHLDTLSPEQHAICAPHNLLDCDALVALICENGRPVACGALRLLADQAGELKRMFVHPAYRGRGLAREMLRALETRAVAEGCRMLVLETSPDLTAAVSLYRSVGFRPIENYGPYRGMNTLCMGKAVGEGMPAGELQA